MIKSVDINRVNYSVVNSSSANFSAPISDKNGEGKLNCSAMALDGLGRAHVAFGRRKQPKTLPEELTAEIKTSCAKAAKEVSDIEQKAKGYLPESKRLLDNARKLYSGIKSGDIESLKRKKAGEPDVLSASYTDENGKNIRVEVIDIPLDGIEDFYGENKKKMLEFLEGEDKPIRETLILNYEVTGVRNFEAKSEESPNYVSDDIDDMDDMDELRNGFQRHITMKKLNASGKPDWECYIVANDESSSLSSYHDHINHREFYIEDGNILFADKDKTLTAKPDGTPVKTKCKIEDDFTDFYYDEQSGQFTAEEEPSLLSRIFLHFRRP